MKDAMRRLTLVAIAMLGACTYSGGTDPISRKLSWYSYLNGDDIRTACVPGAPNQVRLVYNGIDIEQIRTYDIAGDAGMPEMRIRILGQGKLNTLSFDSVESVFKPWTGQSETVALPRDAWRTIATAMKESGALQAPPDGLALKPEDFYWITNSCLDGQFRFNAFRWPSTAFRNATFPGLVLGWDVTGVPINPPREVDPFQLYNGHNRDIDDQRRSPLAVGRDGLIGVHPLF